MAVPLLVGGDFLQFSLSNTQRGFPFPLIWCARCHFQDAHHQHALGRQAPGNSCLAVIRFYPKFLGQTGPEQRYGGVPVEQKDGIPYLMVRCASPSLF